VASQLLEVDAIVMPVRWGPWASLLDGDGRTIGRARGGRVQDENGVLILWSGRGWLPGRPTDTILAGDGSLVGTTMKLRKDREGRKKPLAGHVWLALRVGDSEEVFAEYQDGTVRLAADGREVATILAIRRYLLATDWQLTFSSCENPRLRLMCLWLLACLAPSGDSPPA
jgi:hypothetical protein